jgi:glycolate oxidase FAD binding subunit
LLSISDENLRQTLSSLLERPVREGTPDEAVAGCVPRVVVEPATEEEVAAVLTFADHEGLKVLVRGGGTQLWLGSPPLHGDVLLSTRHLAAVLEHEPHDQTISVQAGMRLVDLQEYLRSAGQWLALDPPLPENATVGGIVATNASGARRLRFGGVRDQIIGIRVVLPDGTIARGGGKVVKNVAGYDLPKLYCGSLGTLGVIVAANFRLYPLPTCSCTVALTAATHPPLSELAERITASNLVPTAIDMLGPVPGSDSTSTLAVRFESVVPAAVKDQSTALLEMAGELASTARRLEDEPELSFWRDVDDLWSGASSREESVLRLKASLLPGAVSGWLARLDSVAADTELSARWRAHAGHGIVCTWLSGPEEALVETVSELRAAAGVTLGSLVVEQAPPSLASRLDIWGPVGALDLMRRIKELFDPHATLNPGRFVGGI